ITRPGESVLRSLGDPELWSLFKEIGVKGVHTGPMKRAGGIRGREYTPTIDGNFDRISTEIDPAFGSDEEYKSMVRRARDNGAVVDGRKLRWVYLHYFKGGQPTFNWLDPTFAAQQLVIGDALHSLGTLGESMLRLDANGFLGIEVGANNGRVWSEGHPLSVTSNQLIAGMVRKLGGFTFQELNLTLDDIKAMSHGGADLSYDFVTRPAYHHALVTGDAEFLRLMLGLQKTYQIDPAGLIHALQNHDELTLELVHFWTRHKDATFTFRGKTMKGSELREII